MDAWHNRSVEKSAFLISDSALVTLGLRALLETSQAGIRVNGSATSYPPEDLLALSNADLIVFDCSGSASPQRIGEVTADIAHTFGKPLLLLADAAQLAVIRDTAQTAGQQVVDRNAPREVLIGAVEACLAADQSPEATAPGSDTRRREARVAVQIPARLDTEACITRNLSARGMYIELQEDSHAVGDTVLIEIDLHSPEGDSTLSLNGEIVRKEQADGRVGLGVRILSSGTPRRKKPAN